MKIFSERYSQYSLLLFYLVVLCWLGIGVTIHGTFTQITYLLGYAFLCVLFFLPCYSFFFHMKTMLQKKNDSFRKSEVKNSMTTPINIFLYSGLLFGICVYIIHMCVLGKIPLLSAALSDDYYTIVHIRQSIKLDTPIWISYLTSFCIRAILPLLILFSLITKRYGFFIIAMLFSIIFCCSLIQKSYIALVFIPSILTALVYKYWKLGLLQIIIAVSAVFLLVYITNPAIRPEINLQSNTKTQITPPSEAEITSPNKAAIAALIDRVFVVPGSVVSQWFELIPSTIPYGYGCGDRVLAKFLHCPHINYPLQMYEALYPEQLKEGIIGSVNAASFMEGYANFGLMGLLLSALELSLWLAFISVLLSELPLLMLAANSLFILLLSSSSLHTQILSGGWALTILIVYLLQNSLKGEITSCAA